MRLRGRCVCLHPPCFSACFGTQPMPVTFGCGLYMWCISPIHSTSKFEIILARLFFAQVCIDMNCFHNIFVCFWHSYEPYTCCFVCADFLYADFNKTTGLIFNGDAYTSSCIDNINVCLETMSSMHHSCRFFLVFFSAFSFGWLALHCLDLQIPPEQKPFCNKTHKDFCTIFVAGHLRSTCTEGTIKPSGRTPNRKSGCRWVFFPIAKKWNFGFWLIQRVCSMMGMSWSWSRALVVLSSIRSCILNVCVSVYVLVFANFVLCCCGTFLDYFWSDAIIRCNKWSSIYTCQRREISPYVDIRNPPAREKLSLPRPTRGRTKQWTVSRPRSQPTNQIKSTNELTH